ncbi:MAG: GNAT family N-acetyltransferase [Alphaproteobacteria bacterium]|nr:GNAT family N-acetyltransferase [Alphaproteobacteria bacterium]
MSHLPAPIAASAGLRDGTQLFFHAITPDDRACIAAGFERLSAASRQSRFLRPMARLDSATLDYLSAVDGNKHLAVGASSSSDERVGLARCVRLADEPGTAEIAVTILDDWQRRGVAPVLATELARWADAVAIRKFRALFSYENHAVARLLAGAGVTFEPDGGGMIRADIEVSAILKAAVPASA